MTTRHDGHKQAKLEYNKSNSSDIDTPCIGLLYFKNMPFPISCGSVGDIIALTQLTIQIKRALSDTQGAPSEYQELVTELDLFHRALLRVKSALPTNTNAKPLDPKCDALDTMNAIQYHTTLAERRLKDFMQTIEKYQKSLQKGGSKNMMLDTWRKLGWTFLKKEDVQHLKTDLKNQRDNISFLLTLYNTCVYCSCSCFSI